MPSDRALNAAPQGYNASRRDTPEKKRNDFMLVWAAIAPHGGDIVEEIADDARVMAQTRVAMQEMGRRCAASRPDTVVVLTPHGQLMRGAITIGATRIAGGVLGEPSRQIKAVFETDLALVDAIADEAPGQKVPLARLVGDDKKGEAVFPLDWGALIPLWYAAHPLTPLPRVVVLAPDRTLPRETLVRCGVAIARASEKAGSRVALIASCDQGHAHDANGPYGYDPASAVHDRAMCEAIASDNLESLLAWPADFMETAKVDAYWQTLILMGALGHTPMTPDLLSYEAPTYFGMIVATFEPL